MPFLYLSFTFPSPFLRLSFAFPSPFLHLSFAFPSPFLHLSFAFPSLFLHLSFTFHSPFIRLSFTFCIFSDVRQHLQPFKLARPTKLLHRPWSQAREKWWTSVKRLPRKGEWRTGWQMSWTKWDERTDWLPRKPFINTAMKLRGKVNGDRDVVPTHFPVGLLWFWSWHSSCQNFVDCC